MANSLVQADEIAILIVQKGRRKIGKAQKNKKRRKKRRGFYKLAIRQFVPKMR